MIGPKIEEWLLNGKAVLKNFSCGGAGLVNIPVPEGKTFIITNIEVLPFVNIITENNIFAANSTINNIHQQDLRHILKRCQMQLVFWNNSINNVYNIREKFGLNTFEASSQTHTAPYLYFSGHSLNTFLIVETNSWLYLKYLDFDTGTNLIYQDYYQPNLPFTGGIFNGSQNWQPTNYFGYSDQQDIANIVNSIGTDYDYYPQGTNTNYNTSNTPTPYNVPALDSSTDPTQSSSFIPPLDLTTGGGQSNPLDERWINSIPFYNIEIIEINKRLTTSQVL